MKRQITVIIACGATKLTTPAPAADLYTSANFRNTLAVAQDMADGGRVFILSALHGLLPLDAVVAPYDVCMGTGHAAEVSVDTIADQIEAHWIADDEVYALLPAAYMTKLDAAAELTGCAPQDVYETAPGIGYQRGVVRHARDAYAA